MVLQRGEAGALRNEGRHMHGFACGYRGAGGRTCITLSGRCSVQEQAVIMATLLREVLGAASPL